LLKHRAETFPKVLLLLQVGNSRIGQLYPIVSKGVIKNYFYTLAEGILNSVRSLHIMTLVRSLQLSEGERE